jgi:hypothetical protein
VTLTAYICIILLSLLLSVMGATIAGGVLVVAALTAVFHHEIREGHRRAAFAMLRTTAKTG